VTISEAISRLKVLLVAESARVLSDLRLPKDGKLIGDHARDSAVRVLASAAVQRSVGLAATSSTPPRKAHCARVSRISQLSFQPSPPS
jgi:hypothetical protein